MSEETVNPSKNELLKSVVTELLMAEGFTGIRHHTKGGIRLCEAAMADGTLVRFWVKKDWNGDSDKSAAIGFGFVPMMTGSSPDAALQLDHVRQAVSTAESAGADYLLLIHMVEGKLRTHYALPINEVVDVYTRQLRDSPRGANEGRATPLWFYQQAGKRGAAGVAHVWAASVPLATIAGKTCPSTRESPAVKTVLAEIERRLQQEAFKNRLGEKYGWRCAVSGNEVREVLDAAHLPGRDWRQHNTVEDGVLLRADLHRLLDSGLATLRDGKFCLEEKALCDQYVDFNGRPIR